MTLHLAAFLTTLSLSFGLPFVVQAQDTTAATEQNITAQETPWQVNCAPRAQGGGLDCSMVKSLSFAEGNQILAQAAVVAGDVGEPFVLRVLAPHGMALSDGLVLKVDGNEMARAAFRTSLPGGAVAVTDMTPDLEAALRAGRMLQIEGVQNNGNALRLEMGLMGFSAAMDKLR